MLKPSLTHQQLRDALGLAPGRALGTARELLTSCKHGQPERTCRMSRGPPDISARAGGGILPGGIESIEQHARVS